MSCDQAFNQLINELETRSNEYSDQLSCFTRHGDYESNVRFGETGLQLKQLILSIIDLQDQWTELDKATTCFKENRNTINSNPMRRGFRVDFLDEGISIRGKNPTRTYIETIKYIGTARIRRVNVLDGDRFPLMMTSPGKNQNEKLGNYYVSLDITTDEKISRLEKIARRLGIRIRIVNS